MSTSRWRRSLAAAMGAVMALTVVTPVQAREPIDGTDGPAPVQWSAPQNVRSVPVRPVAGRTAAPSSPRALTGDPDVTWPPAGTAEVNLTTRAAAAGTLPVAAAAAVSAGATKRSTAVGTAPQRVRVAVRDRAATAKAGVDGLVLAVRRADGRAEAAPVKVSVDYSSFRHAFGGDWASRLRLVPLDGAADPTGVRNDVTAGRVSAQVTVSGTDATYALMAAPAGSAGDYTATSLSPEGRWQVSTSSGAFAWTYPMRVPPVPGGLTPEIAASYNSQAVDGRVAARNNQPSWLGEGWNLGEAFVERSYKACADDMGSGANNTEKTGDLCWETQNATMSFGSRSGRLVALDAAGDTWRLMDDDGTRIQRLTGAVNGDDDGERWVLTATDGTRYHFGLNRLPGWASGKQETRSVWTVPVYANEASDPAGTGYVASNFAASKKDKQAYRWNLDYVVDPNGNAMSYYYATESNKYGANLGRTVVDYVRGGWLERIEYGLRDTNAYAEAPAQVLFSVADRCVPGSSNCAKTNKPAWPDVPWEQECTAAPCTGKYSPTFWSSKRLTTVTTRILPTTGDYVPVDRWNADHSYPDPGDGTSAALWLTQIRHTGARGSEAPLPPVRFVGTFYPNRVNSATDGLPALNKLRVTSILAESGGKTDVSYSERECGTTVPAGNTKRCFPVTWTAPEEADPTDDWFHKYVVTQTVEDDHVLGGTGGGSEDIVTSYTYLGGAAWAKNVDPLVPTAKQTWNEWRGYQKVEVRKGDPAGQRSLTRYQYFRGMNGQSVEDSTGTVMVDAEPLAGFLREEITYNGDGGSEVEGEIHTPWKRSVATQGPFTAYQVENSRTVTRTRLSSGTYRSTRVDTTHDHYGNPIEVDDHGDTTVSGDERCTTTEYAQDADRWMMDLPKQTTTVAVDCDRTPTLPADAIADEQATYDDAGNLAKTEVVSGYTGGEPTWLTTATSTYDMYGRVTETTDSLDRTSKTAYTEARGLTTRTKATDPLGHTVTTDTEPAWGAVVKTTDANGRSSTVKYDPLGRIVEVWQPGRLTTDPASIKYGYEIRNAGGPSWVRTESLAANGNYVTAYQLLDGLLRPRQTQAPSPVGGRIITDTWYDSRGLVARTNAAYHNGDAGPGTTLVVPDAGAVPSATVTVYDGAGRETDSIHLVRNTERWRTRTYHGGDHTSVVPPAGGTATSTHVDARGRTVKLVQYATRPQSGPPSGAGNTTSYTYTPADALASVTDAAGNVWRYSYDVLGRTVSAEDPDKGDSTMTYDNAGQLLTITDARGKTTASSYDALGRLTETRLGSATGTLLTKRVYDTLTGGKGLPTSSTRYVDGNAYTRQVTGYDAAGRPTGDETVIPATETEVKGTYKTSYEYMHDGSIKKVILPMLGSDLWGETLNFTYTNLGQRDTVKGWTTYVGKTEYNELGEVAQVEMEERVGKRLAFTPYYEEDTRRLTKTLVERDKPESPFANDLTYQYDHVGNVRAITDRTIGHEQDRQCFDYDQLRRMTRAWTAAQDCTVAPSTSTVGGPAPYWHSYSYDAIGNRKKLVRHGVGGAADSTSTYAYPTPGDGVARPHAVTSVVTGSTTATYGYDETGNMTSRPGPSGTQTLAWDDEGRLASIASGAQRTDYRYDADGEVLIRRDPGKVTLFLASGEVTVDTATGSKRGTRVYDGIGVRTASGLTWTVADRHGTNTVAIHSGTLEVTPRRTDPFGNPRGTNSAWPAGDRGFVGGFTNLGTGLVRLGAREYDPLLGRFISVDPIIDPADPQQMNAYAYSNNNPATMSDPDGLRFSCPDGDCGGHRGPSANKKGKKHTAAKAPGTSYSKKMYKLYKKRQMRSWKWAPQCDSCHFHAVKAKKKAGRAAFGQHGRSWDENEVMRDQAYREIGAAQGREDTVRHQADEQQAQKAREAAECEASFWCRNSWIVHRVVDMAVGGAVGFVAGAVCVASAGLGCFVAVGMVAGMIVGGPAHIGAAHLIGEEVTDAKVRDWTLGSALGGVLGGIRKPLGIGLKDRVQAFTRGGPRGVHNTYRGAAIGLSMRVWRFDL
ncbi:RHS repeat domain-containing protein [Micromonospora andamanensis]|uniref:RHS repeat domain-containing protein n=2 Tax=Micromonospora andamanensis TaxID=1287068 RepID=UPI00364239DB